MFGRLFGSSQPNQKQPNADLNSSIQQLRSATQQLEKKREVHLEKKNTTMFTSSKRKI